MGGCVGKLPQSCGTHTSLQHERSGRSQRQQDTRAEPCSSAQEVTQNFRGLILGCH